MLYTFLSSCSYQHPMENTNMHALIGTWVCEDIYKNCIYISPCLTAPSTSAMYFCAVQHVAYHIRCVKRTKNQHFMFS